MIKTIVFSGGLGNQMFQYAFYLRLKHVYSLSLFLFDIEQTQGCHGGYELGKVFNVDAGNKIKAYRLLKKYLPAIVKESHAISQKHSLEYCPDVLKERYFNTRYEGFWQSEEFFRPIEKQIRHSFQFQETLISNKTKEESLFLKNSNSVGVHVRRGDYLRHPDYYGLCSKEYYIRGIDFIRKHVENPSFVLFSDDMEWAMENIKCDYSHYVSWNTGADCWQDMYLMSCCRHNIIANSSFSWWGAWLNSNVGKIVIAPTPWFSYCPDYNIAPSKWIRVVR